MKTKPSYDFYHGSLTLYTLHSHESDESWPTFFMMIFRRIEWSLENLLKKIYSRNIFGNLLRKSTQKIYSKNLLKKITQKVYSKNLLKKSAREI